MGKNLTRIVMLCGLLAVLLSATAWAVVSSATLAAEIIDEGDCGELGGSNIHWTLDNTGHLSLTGSGVMDDYTQYSYSDGAYTPWYENHSLITSISVGKGITCIGTDAFYGLENLSRVTLPDSIIRIKAEAFQNCTSLTQITFPDSVASIEDSVFRGCSNLVNFTISDCVTNIGSYAFSDCVHLKKIVIPRNIQNIGGCAFYGCERLQNVAILARISKIPAFAFESCLALTEITIPDSVLIIEVAAFGNDGRLTDVYFEGTENMWQEISVDSGNQTLENAQIHFDTSVDSIYRINALSVLDNDGNNLSAIPNNSFLASISITNRSSGMSPLIFLTAYSTDGQYQGLLYVKIREPIGGTVEFTLPIDNTDGKIEALKAFAVTSFDDLTPIGNVMSFPAA